METELNNEIISALKERKRPELIDCPIYGQYDSEKRTFIYDDSNKRYILQNTRPQQKTVRSVKAFIAIIKEELKRRGNETGNKAARSWKQKNVILQNRNQQLEGATTEAGRYRKALEEIEGIMKLDLVKGEKC